jgi:glycosyltransferase involved in cell wall biosynthesis
MPPGVSVVVPARDVAALIGPMLEALAAQRGAPEWEVVVVDNGSHDETAEVAERSGLPVKVLRRPRGQGPGPARDEGVAHARGRLLAFTDADCRPTPGWLAAGVDGLERSPIVQGAVEPEPGVPVGPFDRTLAVPFDYGLYPAANLFVRRDLFERLGGFGDPFPRPGGRPFGEDAWLVWRARRAGEAVAFSSEALVHHAVLPGGPGEYLVERARAGLFPELVGRIPELREAFCYRRWFLSPRSAAFDLAALGGLLALRGRRATPLLAALPYARALTAEACRFGARQAPAVAAVQAAGDALAAIGLAVGSVRSRTLLL